MIWSAPQQAAPVAPAAPVSHAAPVVPPTPAAGGLEEAFYDPLGSYDQGQFGGPIGGHSDHVHVSQSDPQAMLAAIQLAQQLGLAARENPYVDPVDPVHTDGSYHYRNFPGTYNGRQLGEGLDVSGPATAMARYYRQITGGR